MITAVEYLFNTTSAAEICAHLSSCDADFVPRLSTRVEMQDYAKKIASKATRFEAWDGDKLVGLLAVYCNDQEQHIAFITSVSVQKAWTGKGIAECLVGQCIEHAKVSGMRQISLEVASDNVSAIKLYEKIGFVASKANTPLVGMILFLKDKKI